MHTQDICIPLRIEHPVPVDAAVTAADRVLVLLGPMRPWKPPRGIRLVATEADWADGEGPLVEASRGWSTKTPDSA